ncbi:DUF4136 domain-containing protein [Sphingobium algorifonticola]|uniref:DUF4136 domain-containing protein n=1 Tax=Sphingobium algorifonticola TaxID=2008318 RepID=A0A437J9F7_9SPHN|nr:DUF4136 domain-containing protein [Sphingobium algorifonticola]RVT42104.1 hypothetical protein ENE74_07705 [Sphingobium algorifonticola]
MMKQSLAAAIIVIALAACATAVPPVEVTRFHTANPPMGGTVSIEEMIGNPDISLEFRTYAAAVAQELQRAGFSESAQGKGEYVALVGLRRSFRPTGPDRSGNPVSVGVGGSTGSFGSGLGVGIGINLSGKPKDVVTTELSVQLRRRGDSQAVWEGRALTSAKEGTPAAQPNMAAAKLAAALIGGYPGESGRTITVR